MPASYEVFPLKATPERSEIVSKVLRKTCGFETIFSDFERGCKEKCYEDLPLPEMCEDCQRAMQAVSGALLRPDAIVWEVWKLDEDDVELAGVIRVSRIVAGEDAVGHYLFFDHKLSSKTKVLKDVIGWLFADHEGWTALRRLTVEIPDYAYALARHAQKKLGFGGDFRYESDSLTLSVEGVKREAVQWRGERRDLLLMGLINAEKENAEDEEPALAA